MATAELVTSRGDVQWKFVCASSFKGSVTGAQRILSSASEAVEMGSRRKTSLYVQTVLLIMLKDCSAPA